MDKSFDFGALLKKHAKKTHKSMPIQFTTVGGGVKKRLESSLSSRRSTRLTIFDSTRNLSPACNPLAPALSEVELKRMHRQQQLQKWKEEKQKQKKELASKKKKPFLPAGIAHKSLQFVPPPPPKPVPSTSGRVTRSQASRNKTKVNEPSTSFAPKNAGFKAPEIKNVTKVPNLAPPKQKSKKMSVIFEPVLPPVKEVKQTRSKALKQPAAATKSSRTTVKETKASHLSKTALYSTSSSEYDNVQSSTDDETFKSSSDSSKTQQSSSSSELDKSPNVSTESSKTITKSRAQKWPTPKISIKTKTLLSSSSSEMEKSPNMPPESSKTVTKSNKTQQKLTTSQKSRVSLCNLKIHESTSSSELEKTLDISKKSPRASMSNSKTPQKMTQPRRSNRISQQNEPLLRTPKNSIPKSESSSEERLRLSQSQISTPEQIPDEDKKISPYVTVSRGKDNARREAKMKLEQGLLADDSGDEANVAHFRLQLAAEVERLTRVCLHWDHVAQTPLPDYVLEEILAAVGQARLLVSQKLAQFGALVGRCGRCEAGPPVTPADLAGFWDLVFMQVENVDMRFKKLEDMQRRGWSQELPPAPRPRPGPRPRVPAPGARPRPRAGPSALREAIAAARRAQAAGAPSEPPSRSFEAGFFTVQSPVRAAPSPRTPAAPRDSLLKSVLSSEAKKASATKECASFAMLRAAAMARHADCDGVAPLPPTPVSSIDLTATPGRSILKQATDVSFARPVKTVLFQNDEQSDSDAANELSDPANEQSGSANELSDPANELSDPANELTESANELSDLANELSDPANELSDPANELSDPANELSDASNYMSDPTDNMSNPTNDRSEPTNKLSRRTYVLLEEPKYEQSPNQQRIPIHDKENSERKLKLVRQNAVAEDLIKFSPVVTRSRRNMVATPHTDGKKKKTSRKKKVLEDSDNIAEEVNTPRRSTRIRKSCPVQP